MKTWERNTRTWGGQCMNRGSCDVPTCVVEECRTWGCNASKGKPRVSKELQPLGLIRPNLIWVHIWVCFGPKLYFGLALQNLYLIHMARAKNWVYTYFSCKCC
ncbi:hypothetical protein F383_13139 [Gossypium arboreum]|uniref:Uncharacterized protein n=1 Tax=Gossypium arboreum TaxID=29729 RepID=A0A0B0NDY8_GOSAR|nr:hypothetical protein F383_13139 [Gossypium arboreum]